MNNHKLFQHTVRAEKIKCDYCGETCDGRKVLCKHISSNHCELFPERPDRGNQCHMCHGKFINSEELNRHMDESHSPDSFMKR